MYGVCWLGLSPPLECLFQWIPVTRIYCWFINETDAHLTRKVSFNCSTNPIFMLFILCNFERRVLAKSAERVWRFSLRVRPSSSNLHSDSFQSKSNFGVSRGLLGCKVGLNMSSRNSINIRFTYRSEKHVLIARLLRNTFFSVTLTSPIYTALGKIPNFFSSLCLDALSRGSNYVSLVRTHAR